MNQPSNPGDALRGLKLPRGIELLERVGEGAMATVYRAVQHPLGRDVAVKVIVANGDDAATTSDRVLREASLASQLNHPNSIDIYDYGRTDSGLTYLVMEYLRGQDLASLLHRERQLSVERAIQLTLQVLSALEEAHALGIVHRDVKPENVFVEQREGIGDFAKLVDFGLARSIGNKGSEITAPHLVSGTPEYMAPEQARRETVDGRADLYGVAIMLFQLLSGKRPFAGESPMDVVLMQLHQPAPRLDAADAGTYFPDDLVKIVAKGMEKRPQDRFQTAQEMSAALEEVLLQRRSIPPRAQRSCGACGAAEMHGNYCGVCGASLVSDSGRNAVTQRAVPALVFRARERDWVREQRAVAQSEFVAAGLLGSIGAGKTALLEAIVHEMRQAGDHVVLTGPDAFGGCVVGSTFRELLAQLPGGAEPVDLATSDAARVDALRLAFTLAARGLAGRLVVVVDDLDMVDALSRRALLGLLQSPPDVAFLLILTAEARPTLSSAPVRVREVARLPRERARQLASEEALALWPEATEFTPLGLSHLEAFIAEGGGPAPRTLNGLVAQRVSRTDPTARRVLQLCAAVRCPVPAEVLVRESADAGAAALERLERRGLIRSVPGGVQIAHPLVAQIVREAAPLGMRRPLGARAIEILVDIGAPLEARARAALRGESIELAILLFEQIARRCEGAGDASGAADAYGSIVELCRSDVGAAELSDAFAVESSFVLRWASALRDSSRGAEAGAELGTTLRRLPPERAEPVRAALGTAITQPAPSARSAAPHRSNA